MTDAKPIMPTLIALPAELLGQRLILRPYRAEDAEAVFTAIDESREHLRPWFSWANQHATVDETRDYCVRCAANWLLRSDMNFGIFDINDGRYLGSMGLHHPHWTLRSFMIGYWLRVSAEGNGYMTESVNLLTGFAFEHLGAQRVEISCTVRNARSRAVAERCGFVLEGCLRNAFADGDGNPVDGFIFSRVPSDVNASVTI